MYFCQVGKPERSLLWGEQYHLPFPLKTDEQILKSLEAAGTLSVSDCTGTRRYRCDSAASKQASNAMRYPR